jgi:ribonuclease HI
MHHPYSTRPSPGSFRQSPESRSTSNHRRLQDHGLRSSNPKSKHSDNTRDAPPTHAQFWIGIQKLDSSHIHARLAKTKPTRGFVSPLKKAAKLSKELHVNRAEKIPAVACEPWVPDPKIHIPNREQAKLATAPERHTVDLHTDASIRNGRVGVGVWTKAWEVSRTIAREDETNVHLAELEAIWTAIGHLSHEDNRTIKIRVFSDNQGALHSIIHPRSNDSIHLVTKIRKKIRKVTFSLHWVPGHEGIEGNEKANELAQKATEDSARLPEHAKTVPTSSIYAKAKAKTMNFKPRCEDFYMVKAGKYLQKLDKALPGKHTKKIYNALNKTDASILAQLRTNISRLNSYLQSIKVTEMDKCECGATETVQHFLFLCTRWKSDRQAMRAAHGNRYLDI